MLILYSKLVGKEVRVIRKSKPAGSMWAAGRKITARTFELNAARELQALLGEKIALLPEAPSDEIKPFQIGMHDLIVAAALPDTSLADLKAALRRYTSATGYLMALGLDGSVRYRLDGSVDALVSDDNRDHARKLVKRRFAKMQKKQAAPGDHARQIQSAPEPEKPDRPVLTISPKSGTP